MVSTTVMAPALLHLTAHAKHHIATRRTRSGDGGHGSLRCNAPSRDERTHSLGLAIQVARSIQLLQSGGGATNSCNPGGGIQLLHRQTKPPTKGERGASNCYNPGDYLRLIVRILAHQVGSHHLKPRGDKGSTGGCQVSNPPKDGVLRPRTESPPICHRKARRGGRDKNC